MTYLEPAGESSAEFHARDEVESLTYQTSGTHVRFVFAPGEPRENYFRALAEIRQSGRTMTEDEWTEFLAQHDQYSAE